MKRLLMLMLAISLIVSGCTSKKDSKETINILTGIDPIKTFVEKVAGDKVVVTSLIKEGNSPVISKFTPKQMTLVEDTDLYFYTGVPAEINLVEKLPMDNLELVDLLDKVADVYPEIKLYEEHEEDMHHEEHEEDMHHEEHEEDMHHEEHEEDMHHEGHVHGPVDPHIWLSPKRAIEIVKIISVELSEIDEENKEYYEDNAAKYIEELKLLDKEIKDEITGGNILVFHSSFSYFADDYGINLISVEENGKKASINRIASIIEEAKELEIDKVFYQGEFDKSQVQSIADELGVELIEIKALTGDYINNLRDIKNKIKDKNND
ncbi:MAG: zinc ABC transporter substrate-binding protein [Clostridia bacterium]|jgi:zinc transport system substrate-binding protein|nr:zinc ABC transporter substrate-binding protein [Clostridia bacterium]